MVPQEAHDNPCSKRLERGEKDATVHFSLCLQLQERERVLDTPVSRLSKQVRWTAKIPSTNYSRRGTPHTYGNLILVMLYALMLLFAYTQVHVRGDLPSHCLFRHVLGKWEMEEGLWQPCKGEGESNTLLHDPYCGYQVPDRPFDRGPVIPPDVDPSFRRLRTTTFTLSSDSTVVFDDGSTGIWTMVYDEGFHLEVSGPQNRRYFAFFKYEIAKDGTNRAWSFCHTTLIGWWERLPEGEHSLNYLERLPPFYDVPHPVPETQADKAINRISRGCWWARKLGEDLTVPTNEVPRVRRSPIEVPLWPTSKPPDISAVVAHVRRVHSADDSWSPVDTVYIDVRGLKLQKLQDVFRHTGQPLLMPREYPDPPLQLVSGTPPVRVSSARPYGSPAGTDPPWMTIREFDWTNPEHVNMRIGRRMSVVSEAPDQGGCGSCYALTTGTVLTSRLWIRYAQHDDVFGKIRVSPFQGTSCNVYNQGCDGGFVFLALKFGQEHGFRTEECLADYGKQKQQQQGSLTAHLQKCHDLGGQLGTSVYGCRAPPARATLPSSCETAIRVTSWRYVGGVYGGCSEREMLRALWEHGPLGASIEPPASFVVYKKGVFKSAYNRYVEQGPSWVWEKVDHAVVIVGWGWEKHGNEWLPYWKVRNSWGRKWGEGGYARVIRGVNEMAIERVAVMADVALFRNGLPISPRQARTGVPSRNSQTYETKHSMPSNQDSRAAPDEATPDDQESESESESSGKSYSNSDSSADESTGESNEEERSIRDGETPVTPLLRSIRAHHEQLPVQVKM